jgi:endonuclease YncB( thermonuclease family)
MIQTITIIAALLAGSWDALQESPSAEVEAATVLSTLADLRACGLTAGPIHKVTSIIDGDTFVIDTGREVRLVGLQAPKLPLGRRGFDPWPLGDEAKHALDEIAFGKTVRLMYGGSREDRHGRILAHILILEDEAQKSKGTWLAGEMISRGMARVYTFRDNRSCAEELLVAENVAREEGLGIWSDKFYRIRSSDKVDKDVDTFQLVEGQVQTAAMRSNGAYLDFGQDWRTDFSLYIAKRNLKRFEKANLNIMSLAHKNIRVRGWIDYRSGPIIELTHPEQIEILSDR